MIFYPGTAEHTFFSGSHATLTKMDYILGHKTYLNHLVLSDHNEIKLEVKERYLENLKIFGC